MKIRFMSGNKHKIVEVQRILTPVGVDIVPVSRKIEELQTQDVHALVRDKLIKAFQEIGRPLFVEHTGLYLGGLNELPAGLTQIFWDRLEANRFVDLPGLHPCEGARGRGAGQGGVSGHRHHHDGRQGGAGPVD